MLMKCVLLKVKRNVKRVDGYVVNVAYIVDDGLKGVLVLNCVVMDPYNENKNANVKLRVKC